MINMHIMIEFMFLLYTGARDEAEARSREEKMEERRRRLADEAQLRELRWPYASTRAKVYPTQRPEYPSGSDYHKTRSHLLRTLEHQKEREAGR